MEEVNLDIMKEPRITYISSLLPSNFKKWIIATLQELKDCLELGREARIGQKLGRTPLAYQDGISPLSATTKKNVQGGRDEGKRGDLEAFEG